MQKWAEKDVKVNKCTIDDGIIVEKINFHEESLLEREGVRVKEVHAAKTEANDHITRWA